MVSEKPAGEGRVDPRHFLGRAGGDDFTAAVAAFGTQVDDVVGRFDYVEMVLDHYDAVTGFDQPVQAGSRWTMSARCSPVVGSSRMYRIWLPRRSLPSSLASLMRWASPPERVVADWPSVR